ncbi:hypothetical protein Golomagni_01261 [Golovinomyces magnicellulatus]|nr:hypothetical protein Golomagni_01261 [Golovinomyces magnicellulatus]
MSTSADYTGGKTDDVNNESNLRSRDIRSTRTAESGKSDRVSERTSSTSTLKSSSSSQKIRAERRRLFPSIEYASRVSHFDPQSNYRDFQGFYVLFWVALTIMVITTALRNVKDTGYPVRVEIWRLFTVKVWELAYADGLMIATTVVSLLLHQFLRSKPGKKIGLRWHVGGMAIQSAYQLVWFSFWVA